jgi:FHA domain
MTDRARGGRWRDGGPVPARRRKRWMIAAAVAAAALLLISVTGSVLASLAVLVLAAVLAGLAAVALRALGFGRDHPAVQALATRPWRDGREVFGLALRHLHEVFIVTPNGSRLAPSAVELCMNPRDVDALADIIDLELVNASAAEAYAAEIEASGAQVRRDLPLEVRVVADPAVPAGRYWLRQRRPGAAPAGAGPPGHGAAGWWTGSGPRPDLPPTDPMTSGALIADAAAGAGPARAMSRDPGRGEARPAGAVTSDPGTSEAVTAEAMMAGAVTREVLPSAVALAGRALAPNPLLRLVTGDYVTQTRVSGARAGRGFGTELTLPDDPTLSRVHATFTCTDGLWRISGTGRNGLALNGIALSGEEVIRDGDFIRWGLRADALSSRVQIER